jgi:hypothetical protein
LNAAIALVSQLFWSELGRRLTLYLVTKPMFCLPLAKMILISSLEAIVDGTTPEPMLIPAIEPAPAGGLRSPTHTSRTLTHALITQLQES